MSPEAIRQGDRQVRSIRILQHHQARPRQGPTLVFTAESLPAHIRQDHLTQDTQRQNRLSSCCRLTIKAIVDACERERS